MNTKLITGGVLAGALMTTTLAGAVSAQTLAASTGLTAAQAIEIALMEVPGDVTEMELENEDGTMVYEVEITSATGEEIEVIISAVSGEILEIETEDEDDHDEDEDEDEDDDDHDGEDHDDDEDEDDADDDA